MNLSRIKSNDKLDENIVYVIINKGYFGGCGLDNIWKRQTWMAVITDMQDNCSLPAWGRMCICKVYGLGSRAECALHNQADHKEKRVCTTCLPHFPKSSSRSLHSERWSRDTHVTMNGENLLPWKPERQSILIPGCGLYPWPYSRPTNAWTCSTWEILNLNVSLSDL